MVSLNGVTQICFPKYTTMEAIKTQSESNTSINHGATTPNWIQKFDETAEFNRYGIISVGFLLVGILGGATVGIFGFDAVWKLATVVGFSMLSLTLMLAIAPIKYVTRSILLALLVDLIVVIVSTI